MSYEKPMVVRLGSIEELTLNKEFAFWMDGLFSFFQKDGPPPVHNGS